MKRSIYALGVRTSTRNAWADATARPTEFFVRRRVSRLDSPPFTLIGVYRAAKSDVVRGIASEVKNVCLWALNEVDPSLAHVTVGSGPGTRAELLNHLASHVNTPYVVLTDDDVRFEVGDINRLVALAHRFSFDLSQPGMSWRGHSVHRLVIKRGLSVARRTNFVEVGPVVVVGPRLRDQILPLPLDFGGFSYGLDVKWMELCETHHARFGIIDAVVARHLDLAGASGSYDGAAEVARFNRIIAETGGLPLRKRWRTFQTVRPWQV